MDALPDAPFIVVNTAAKRANVRSGDRVTTEADQRPESALLGDMQGGDQILVIVEKDDDTASNGYGPAG